jgi:hypothetical protein
MYLASLSHSKDAVRVRKARVQPVQLKGSKHRGCHLWSTISVTSTFALAGRTAAAATSAAASRASMHPGASAACLTALAPAAVPAGSCPCVGALPELCPAAWENTASWPCSGEVMVIAAWFDMKFILDTNCADLLTAAAIQVRQQAHSLQHRHAAVFLQYRAERNSELPAALLHAECQAAAVPLHKHCAISGKVLSARQDAACSGLTGC